MTQLGWWSDKGYAARAGITAIDAGWDPTRCQAAMFQAAASGGSAHLIIAFSSSPDRLKISVQFMTGQSDYFIECTHSYFLMGSAVYRDANVGAI